MPAFDTKTYRGRNYIAPTVFLRAGQRLATLNYYSSLDAAVKKYLYLSNMAGGSNSSPSGTLTLSDSGYAETIGINCDFFALINGSWQFVSYAYLKNLTTWPPIIFRFLQGQTSVISYAIYSHGLMGLSATKVADYSSDKIDALDSYFREVKLLELRYNTLASFLNLLASGPMDGFLAATYKQGESMLNSLRRDLDQSTVLYYQMSTAKIGVPVLLLIAGIAIFSTAAAWSVSTILQEVEKTKRINESYDLQKWVADRKIDVGRMVTNGELSQSEANQIKKSLDATAENAGRIAENSAKKNKGFFAGLNSTLMLILAGGASYYFITKSKKS